MSKHTCCTIFGIFILFLGCLPCFFLQSGSVVLDCGHTPGQQSQCQNTPAAHIQNSKFFFLGSWLLAPCSQCMHEPIAPLQPWYPNRGVPAKIMNICCRPHHVECTGSLPTSEVKRHRARSVLGWGTAWEDFRVLTAFT